MSNKHNRGLMPDTIIDETTISEDTVEESTVEQEEVSEEIVEEPIEQPSEKVRGIVRCINLNVRKEPNLDSTKIGCLKTGDEIIIAQPCYVNYVPLAELCQVKAIVLLKSVGDILNY